jgi:hypothetical protein
MLKHGSVRLAEADLRAPQRAEVTQTFDIFLSHYSEDATIIAGVKALMEADGLRVYVDWVDDPQLDRTRVTAANARTLRTRMDHSRHLVYASSRTSSSSRWMPWELGYFDGHRTGHISILPIVEPAQPNFAGVEFLGLYPVLEWIPFQDHRTRFARRNQPSGVTTLANLAQR